MNEPTIKLYKQAQEFAYKNISKEYWNTDNFHAVVSGKFAELIVRECAEIAKKVDGNESDDYQSGRTWAGIDVLEHFGVKE
jgi:hypothetical protein